MVDPPALGIRTERGWEARLRPRGAGRFVAAAFLAVWLAGWAAGETFAVSFLARGIASWWGGATSGPRMPAAAAIAIGGFLVAWLALWTVGGIAAMHELLRLLWGGTSVIVSHDRVVVEQRVGPFRSRREAPRQSVQAVRAVPSRGGAVALETAGGRIDVFRTSNVAERDRLAEELRRELGLAGAQDDSAAALPAGWIESVTPEGAVAVMPDPALRAKYARVLGVPSLVGGIAALLLAGLAPIGASGRAPAIAFGVVALALAGGTLWLARARSEWRIEGGRLVLQRRSGDRTRERFVARGLELSARTDGDGDEWFTLTALAEPPADPAATRFPLPERPPGPLTHTVLSVLNDASAPRALGRWLAARSGVPLADRTGSVARAIELAEMRARLAASGPLGALADRLLGGALERRERRSGKTDG